MRKAFSAFALGEKWGASWGDLVEAWLDIEAACGYEDDGGQLETKNRPKEVHLFFKHGRKWYTPPAIKKLGRLGEKGTYADDWWLWWRAIQPEQRIWFGGMLTSPTDITWGKLVSMHGRVGFLQVVASLMWWGLEEHKAATEGGRASGWLDAVCDVVSLLRSLVQSGELKKYIFKSVTRCGKADLKTTGGRGRRRQRRTQRRAQ
ncbi:hypothetical protein B0H15DRAFT_781762 [Mycena belliarum]|uniref:Uncharacterized protein n=1 Tax=Mycena belliarum TaxID=1033014 RepID=A0AAD6XQD9_9AGAR|nr:hypothetical protein B0H15DRAFT_781762 [Mycena belliae]